jgi:hypothetical protein
MYIAYNSLIPPKIIYFILKQTDQFRQKLTGQKVVINTLIRFTGSEYGRFYAKAIFEGGYEEVSLG